MNENKIYLKPHPDRTWSAIVSTEKPSADCVLFTSEGEYPTEIIFSRRDINGSGVLSADECPNRESLLASLNWIGQCGFTILNLWNYDIEYPWDAKVEAIFDAAFNRRYENEQIAAAELFESFYEPSNEPDNPDLSWSFVLDSKLIAQVKKREDGKFSFSLWEPKEDGSKDKLYAVGLVPQEDITSLSSAVAWVFQNFSKSALDAEKQQSKPSLNAQIQSAEDRSEGSKASNIFESRER